ncbi:hypothetical protein F5Y18DRAFT_93314 [Xylariaceae sp. FL1019]|nr:hypothetical protein F5Y18DRAFT_93314 [Xylariaceae sp. FL1019]
MGLFIRAHAQDLEPLRIAKDEEPSTVVAERQSPPIRMVRSLSQESARTTGYPSEFKPSLKRSVTFSDNEPWASRHSKVDGKDFGKTLEEHEEETVIAYDDVSSLYNLNLVTSQGTRIVSWSSDGSMLKALLEHITCTETEVEKEGLRAGFVPRTQFEFIMTHEAIEKALKKIESSLLKRIPKWRAGRKSDDIKRETRLINGTSSDFRLGRDRARCYRRIFATLLLIGYPGLIRAFIADAVHGHGICDDDLPLMRAPLSRSLRPFRLRSKNNAENEVSFSCLSLKSPVIMRKFEKAQWKVLAPVIDHKCPSTVQDFNDRNIILPFLTYTKIHESPLGCVHKVKIHPEHHNFSRRQVGDPRFLPVEAGLKISKTPLNDIQDSPDVFAIKSVACRGNMEHRMLKRVKHKHVVQLLATYLHRDKYNYIFPYARRDLDRYWEAENPMPTCDGTTLIWVLKQCAGIAGALHGVHSHSTTKFSSLNIATLSQGVDRPATKAPLSPKFTRKSSLYQKPGRDTGSQLYYGHHGDIKPSNLLWFCDTNGETYSGMGIVKLTDFGSGDFNKLKSTRRSPSSLARTLGYNPPECNNMNFDFDMSYEYDIWSLGCIFLEYITWFSGGWELLMTFRTGRQKNQYGEFDNGCFFDFTRPNDGSLPSAFIKTTVKEHLASLRQEWHSSSAIIELLELIEKRMFRILKVYHLGDERRSGQAYRPEAREIEQQLDDLVDTCYEQQEAFGILQPPADFGGD